MKKGLLLLVLWALALVSVQANPTHEFHATLAEVRYNPSSNSFEVGIRYFTDDLAAVLTKQKGKPVAITHEAENEQLVAEYTMRRFEMRTDDGQSLLNNYLGFENEGELTWVYLEIPASNYNIATLNLRNMLLFDYFADQVNNVNIYVNDQVATLVFRAQQEIELQQVLFSQR